MRIFPHSLYVKLVMVRLRKLSKVLVYVCVGFLKEYSASVFRVLGLLCVALDLVEYACHLRKLLRWLCFGVLCVGVVG